MKRINTFLVENVITIGFLLSCFIWLLISPLGSTPDEPAHINYAASTVRGDLGLNNSDGIVVLPKNIAESSIKTCMAFNPEIPANCQAPLTADLSETEVKLGTLGYPPLYYAAVGLPTLFGFSEFIWYQMRIISIALSFLIFASSIRTVKSFINRNEMLGINLALVPMVTYLVASINPNGLEIVSGLSLSILLAKAPELLDFAPRKYLVQIFLISIVVATVRPYSWLLLIGILVAFVIRDAQTWIKFFRERFFVAFAALLIPLISGIAVTYFMNALKPRSIETSGSQVSMLVQLKKTVMNTLPGLDNYLSGTPGIYGWMDHVTPQFLGWAWATAVVIVALRPILTGINFRSLGISVLFIGSTVIAPIGIYWLLFTDGVGYQPRYAMALVCSIPIISLVGIKNVEILDKLTAKVIHFLMLTIFFSAWIISLFRYSHGFPFNGSALEMGKYSWWLNPFFGFSLMALFSIYFFTQIEFTRNEQIKEEIKYF